MKALWIKMKNHPNFKSITNVEYAVKRWFDLPIPVTAVRVMVSEKSNVGVEVDYINFAWDETMADRGLRKRRVIKLAHKNQSIFFPFDTPACEFQVTLVSDRAQDELRVHMITADDRILAWDIFPQQEFEYLRPITQ